MSALLEGAAEAGTTQYALGNLMVVFAVMGLCTFCVLLTHRLPTLKSYRALAWVLFIIMVGVSYLMLKSGPPPPP
jgi:hypothetical protein